MVTNEVLNLIIESSEKLKEMMNIIVNTGIANGTMAKALQIMMDE